MLDRHARDRHLPGDYLDDAVRIIAVDDRLGRSFTFDREIAPDVQVAGGVVVLAGAGIVSKNVPLGTMMVSELCLALAAMIAERSEICPEASFPFCRFTATVSSVVLM